MFNFNKGPEISAPEAPALELGEAVSHTAAFEAGRLVSLRQTSYRDSATLSKNPFMWGVVSNEGETKIGGHLVIVGAGGEKMETPTIIGFKEGGLNTVTVETEGGDYVLEGVYQNSPEAENYFKQNPEMVEVAEKMAM
jgi:hypothetical protein